MDSPLNMLEVGKELKSQPTGEEPAGQASRAEKIRLHTRYTQSYGGTNRDNCISLSSAVLAQKRLL